MVAKTLILAALSVFAAAAPNAGRFGCLTEEPSAEILAAAQKMQKDEAAGNFTSIQATIEVDMYFHVVSASSSVADGNVPDSQLQQQLSVMNQAYAPHSIHFNLKGTTRTINSKWADDGDEVAMKKALRKGTYSTLNVYYLRKVGGAFGYCYFPTSGASSGSTTLIKDGCSILSSTVPGGSSTNFNLGGTVIHEVGHWFGLFHTFQGNSCTGSGDSVSDTPAQASATSGCPSSRDSCPNQSGLDPIHNYMDYSYDTCYEEFTSGQRTRMYNMWSTYRG